MNNKPLCILKSRRFRRHRRSPGSPSCRSIPVGHAARCGADLQHPRAAVPRPSAPPVPFRGKAQASSAHVLRVSSERSNEFWSYERMAGGDRGREAERCPEHAAWPPGSRTLSRESPRTTGENIRTARMAKSNPGTAAIAASRSAAMHANARIRTDFGEPRTAYTLPISPLAGKARQKSCIDPPACGSFSKYPTLTKRRQTIEHDRHRNLD